jgi:hypothetical protein
MTDSAPQRSRFDTAAEAYRRDDLPEARRQIALILSDDPKNLSALKWAFQLADSTGEKIRTLEEILRYYPNDETARAHLERWRPAQPLVEIPGTISRRKKSGPSTWLVRSKPGNANKSSAAQPDSIPAWLLPFALINKLPFIIPFMVLVVLVLIGAYLYYQTNTISIGGPPVDHWQFSQNLNQVRLGGVQWNIAYEKAGESTFSGTVRYVVPIRSLSDAIITHDILVVSGDYADGGKVSISVDKHQVAITKLIPSASDPVGQINLLHTVPANAAVYNQLLQVRNGQKVTISGLEIYSIETIANNQGKGVWTDSVYTNSLLVQKVEIYP